MTNTYTSLCDSVGIKPILGCTAYDILSEDEADAFCDDYCGQCKYHGDIYPEQSAEQREKLLKLIFNKRGNLKMGYASFMTDLANKETFIAEAYEATHEEMFLANTKKLVIQSHSYYGEENYYGNALYALTHKLVAEGILSNEEVAKALKGGE